MKIKISVIIPIYNMGTYLKECLQSVLVQTLKEIEIICINDGSTDNSLEILNEYASKYRNVIIINQENCGVATARNKGLDLARGEYVAFMDPDDFYPANDILECLYVSAIDNRVLICGGSYSSYRNGALVREYYGRFKDYTFPGNCKLRFSDYQFGIGFTRYIYQLQLLRKNHLYFPLYTRCEDLPFLVKAMVYADEFYALQKITYCYRVGHKKTILNAQKTIDTLKGYLDMLIISREHKLSKLHSNIVNIMQEELSHAIYKHISEGNSELNELVSQINRVIDLELIPETDQLQHSVYLFNNREIADYVRMEKKKEQEFLRILKEYKEIIIYGAGKVGVSASEYLQAIDDINILCFAVEDESKNPVQIGGIPVKPIDELKRFNKSALLLIATFSYLHQEIEQKLKEMNFENIQPIHFNELQLYSVLKEEI